MPTKFLLGLTYFLASIWWLSNSINAAGTLETPSKFQVYQKYDDEEVKCQKGKTVLADL